MSYLNLTSFKGFQIKYMTQKMIEHIFLWLMKLIFFTEFIQTYNVNWCAMVYGIENVHPVSFV